MTDLKVSYSVIDEAISALKTLYSHPESTYITLGNLRNRFSTSNSACAKELILALDKYSEIHELIRELSSNASDMLFAAKCLYQDMDETMNDDLK